jgi:hypothetical protein
MMNERKREKNTGYVGETESEIGIGNVSKRLEEKRRTTQIEHDVVWSVSYTCHKLEIRTIQMISYASDGYKLII